MFQILFGQCLTCIQKNIEKMWLKKNHEFEILILASSSNSKEFFLQGFCAKGFEPSTEERSDRTDVAIHNDKPIRQWKVPTWSDAMP